ncbi:putative diphthamide biosynthesis protein 4 protein [Diplogelasinospora grovesii]|uniref:Diphthamide biosynthesis protein 4 n=1 Tax=Diplogelasinospora grovesii TaxID=303347 RepID=A0AAN6S8F8_9PEZI|nr:putative diphthamide biosynthesis protein 4 protein [Diplogelasinospora grovesii]
MAAASQHIKLALSLPPRLRTFLARYPPASILPAASLAAAESVPKTAYQEETPNPFLPTKHPATGKWHDPKYSLRRQAELVKLAREHGVEELLPYTPKLTEERIRKRVELGLRVKGTGVGQQVKGHKHERHLKNRMEKRRKAMLEMPDLIREWKKVREKMPTYYEILSISQTAIDTSEDGKQLLKRAYRRALLKHHPDKNSTSSHSQSGVSVDQISDALTVLSDPSRRQEYDRALKLGLLPSSSGGGGVQAPSQPQAQYQPEFQTGIENVDLDDLDFDEQDQNWFRSCRCGNPRGYLFGEADLEEAIEAYGGGELIVGCADCSLWLRVHFAVVNDEDGGGGGAESHVKTTTAAAT